MPRLRVRFSRGEELKFISHLDIMRLWQRALRRAGISLAYSEGFNPRPRLSLAAPLAVGVTSEAELMDIYLTGQVSPYFLIAAVNRQLPPGMEALEVYQALSSQPSLQSLVRYAEYEVVVATEKNEAEVGQVLKSLLELKHLPWQHKRDTAVRSYDLRVLIDELWFIGLGDDGGIIGMRLRCDSGGSGRPEQVVKALGFTERPRSIHRTRLIVRAN